MEKTRLDDMVERYGEICSQQVAAKILGVVPRTIARMMEEGRLRRVGRRVDVRSIAAYIENPEQANFEAKVRKGAPTSRLSEGTFLNEFAGASKSTITLCVGILKNIFSCAYAEGIIPRDPSVALVRPKSLTRNERRPLTPDETKRILHIARNHPDGLLLAVLYYTGVRRGEALGLKWGDFDFTEDQVHIQRDIDFTGPTAQEGALKTAAADRYIPIPPELKELLLQKKGRAGEYVFCTSNGKPLSQATFKRIWCRLMLAADCVEWREKKPNTNRENDILKCIKPIITPHYLRHNYITLLYEAGVDPLIAMKIAGHSDYQTTASVYTHIRDEMLKKSTVNMDEVFRKREE